MHTFFLDTPVPGSFWSNPAFIIAMVTLMTAFGGLITALTSWVAFKVKTIETHTNGMLTTLQQKVDDQNVLREATKVLTDKNIEIAALKKDR